MALRRRALRNEGRACRARRLPAIAAGAAQDTAQGNRDRVGALGGGGSHRDERRASADALRLLRLSPESYAITWPAPGDPKLAARVEELLGGAGFATGADAERGFDHGTFVPLKVAYPDADIPTVQLSLKAGLDPAEHLAMGRALAPLRDEGVFIVGSGMTYHNLRAFGPAAAPVSEAFDAWLGETATLPEAERDRGSRRGRARRPRASPIRARNTSCRSWWCRRRGRRSRQRARTTEPSWGSASRPITSADDRFGDRSPRGVACAIKTRGRTCAAPVSCACTAYPRSCSKRKTRGADGRFD